MEVPEEYTTFALSGVTHAAATKRLGALKRVAIVSPTIQDFTFVYDKKAVSDESVITKLGQELSGSLRCPVLAVRLRESFTLSYWLFEAGSLVDEYCDNPPEGPTDDSGFSVPVGGNAERLSAAFSAAQYSELVETVLREPWLRGAERHVVLAAVLRMPQWLIRRTFLFERQVPSWLQERGFARVRSR